MSFEPFIESYGFNQGSRVHPSANPHGYGMPMSLGRGGGFGPFHPYGPHHPYGRGPRQWYPSTVSYPYTTYPCMCSPYESYMDCYQRKLYHGCPGI